MPTGHQSRRVYAEVDALPYNPSPPSSPLTTLPSTTPPPTYPPSYPPSYLLQAPPPPASTFFHPTSHSASLCPASPHLAFSRLASRRPSFSSLLPPCLPRHLSASYRHLSVSYRPASPKNTSSRPSSFHTAAVCVWRSFVSYPTARSQGRPDPAAQ